MFIPNYRPFGKVREDMRIFLSIFLILVSLQNLSASSKNIENFELTSKIFNNTRTIRILLPPEYKAEKNKNRHYPVFYLNDGLMVFDSAEMGLQIEDTVYKLYKSKTLPEMIIVGIDNGACTDKTQNEIRDRANEFLPYPDAGFLPDHTYAPIPPDPQGKHYPDFVVKEVMVQINRRYRTLTGSSNTSIGGFSYGGVSALYTAIQKPGTFGKLLLESTPLWIGLKNELLEDAKNAEQWPESVYVGKGTKETDEEAFNQEGIKRLELLKNIITEKSPHTRLQITIQPGAIHSSQVWRSRLADALRFLFDT